MKHVKLFENFRSEGDGRIYATCFQGDAYVGVGILNKEEVQKLQDALERLNAISDAGDYQEYIDFVDVTGMGYVLHNSEGEFKAMPKSTNPDDYMFSIDKDGNFPYNEDGDIENSLFALVDGKLLVMDHQSDTELVSVDKFIKIYMGV